MLLVAGLAGLLTSAAGATFGGSITMSPDGARASAPRIAVDAQDNALAVWTEEDNGVERVRAAFRPPGGDVATLDYLSAADANAERPIAVFDEHGNALVVWTLYEGAGDGALGRVQAAYRPAGGSFGPARTISGAEPGVQYLEPHVDVDESATVVWTRADAKTQRVQAAFRSKHGSFGPPQTISGPGGGYQPQVAVDERGNSIAVWTTTDTSEIQSASRPRTGGWSVPGRISPAGHAAFSPRVAADRRNNAVAVWFADDDPGVDDPDFIQAARRPAGGSFGAAETLSDTSGTAFDPQVTFDARDNALLAWTRFDGSTTRVETSSLPQGTTSFTDPETVSPAGEQAFEPRIAADDSAAVVWSTGFEGGPLRVHGAFRPAGGTFGGAQTLSEPGDSSYEPAVAMDGAGNALAAWTRDELTDHPVVQFSFRPRVGSFGEPSAMSAPGAAAFEAQVATDRLGNTIAAWTVDPDLGDPDNPTLVQAAFAPPGGAFGAPVRLSDPNFAAYQPRVAYENDGDAVVAWTENEHKRLRVHAAFHVAGNGWVAAAQLSPDTEDAFDPRVSAGPGTVVAWSQTDGAITTTQAAVKPEDASFQPAGTVSRPDEDAHGPQVAVGEDGTAVITWYGGFGDYVAAAIGNASPAGFAAAETLSPPGMAASEPQVAVDDRGGAAVVWIGGNNSFIQAAFRARRGPFGPSQDVAADNVAEPQVAIDESGNAIAAWTRYTDETGQIETAVRPRGGSFGEPAVISATGEELSNYLPHIAADDSAAVVWTAQTPFGVLRVQSSFRPSGGAFGPVQTLTDRLVYGYDPQLVVDERGNVRAIWTLSDVIGADQPSSIQSAFRPRA